MQSLADCFPVLLEHLPEALINAAAGHRLMAAARHLPARIAMHQVVFECPLGQLNPTADLHVTARRAQGGACLLREAAAWSGCAADGQRHEAAAVRQPAAVWQRVQALAQVWDQSPWDCRLDDLALIFDSSAEPPESLRLMVGPLIESHDDALWEAWGREVLPCLLGYPPDRILLDLLQYSRRLLPGQSCVFQVGALPIGRTGVRVALSHMRLEGILEYLRRMDVQHDQPAFQQVFLWLRHYADQFTLHLDIPARHNPCISVECHLDAKRSARPLPARWALFLHALEARGLCQPEKHQALLQCAASIVGEERMACWPREALQLQHLMNRQSVLQRRIGQITLDFDAHGVRRARAGVLLGHEWGDPWHSQHGGTC